MRCIRRQFVWSSLAAWLQIIVYFHSAAKTINESDIVKQCRSIVKVLPINNANAYTESYQKLREDKYSASDVQARRCAICISRYYQLIDQGNADQELIQRGYRRAPMKGSAQKRLFIMNLDGTLLDQQTMHRNPISMEPSQDQALLVETLYDQIAHYYNAKDLTFGLKQRFGYHSRRRCKNCVHFDTVIYRPHVLDLIHRFRADSEFVIYSLAERQDVIPHVIQLEMYYNLVFRIRSKRNQHSYGKTGDFKFLRVISELHYNSSSFPENSYSLRENKLYNKRGGVIHMKSLSIVRSLVNMDYFDVIHIVDDTPKIWIPLDNPLNRQNRASAHQLRIFGHDAPEFVVEAYDPKWSVYVKRIVRVQRSDSYIRDLIRFVNVRDRLAVWDINSSLSWMNYDDSQRMLRTTYVLQMLSMNQKESPLYSMKDIEMLQMNRFRTQKRACSNCVIS